MEFINKTILILAQEPWGDMFISKHHYAIELAKTGNTVYFVNGPDQENTLRPGEIKISPTDVCSLFLVEHRLFYPYIIKFKAPALHQIFMRLHINNIIKKIKCKVDIVWSFDLSNTIPLKCFPKDLIKIFMPVDEPLHKVAIKAADGADVIFSVTNEILEKYFHCPAPKHFINHGVSEIFINKHPDDRINKPLRIGLSGNMLRPDIDHKTILLIVKSNRDLIFDFWGTVDAKKSNLIAERAACPKAIEFIKALSHLPNVCFHGQLSSKALAFQLKKVDAFLICYDIKKDQSRGTNYHKVMEYLATGKIIISNNITTYNQYPVLVQMIDSRDNNDALPFLFKNVIKNIEKHNSIENQEKRIAFAAEATYQKQIKKIEHFLSNSCNKAKTALLEEQPITFLLFIILCMLPFFSAAN